MPSTSLRPISNQVATASAKVVVDLFAQASEVAKPTLDAMVKLRDTAAWLREGFNPLFDVDGINLDADVQERLRLLPGAAALQEAVALFETAVCKSALEPWYYVALGAMLSSMPNAGNVSADYQFAIVDMILHDDEAWEKGCEPGFSPPVFICAIRQVRRENRFVPTAAEMLAACQDQRKRFRQMASDASTLLLMRENAEQALKTAWTKESIERRRARARAYADDEDLPF